MIGERHGKYHCPLTCTSMHVGPFARFPLRPGSLVDLVSTSCGNKTFGGERDTNRNLVHNIRINQKGKVEIKKEKALFKLMKMDYNRGPKCESRRVLQSITYGVHGIQAPTKKERKTPASCVKRALCQQYSLALYWPECELIPCLSSLLLRATMQVQFHQRLLAANKEKRRLCSIQVCLYLAVPPT